MNKVITVVLIVGALWGAWMLRDYYLEKKAANPGGYDYGNNNTPEPAFDPRSLSGLHYSLEQPLQNAQKSGAEGLKKFIDQYRGAIRDPRLAWIELDYVNLVALKDPAQARATFAEVKQRIPTNSPVRPRIDNMSKVYD
ncbi:MAG TPA: hypothetical protein DCY13_21450 [Verrucomicrobiales bacterium]|nr:hypothetical protein [Verrucomicrobiales bacterium]